jgi:Mg2+/Co2+ transporter CorB
MDIDLETWLSAGTILVLLAASAFFSGSETALTAASRARMHTLEQEGIRAAKSVNILLGARDRLIGVLLLGNNIVNILRRHSPPATSSGASAIQAFSLPAPA